MLGAKDLPSLVPQPCVPAGVLLKAAPLPCILYGPTCDAFDRLFEEEVQLPELDMGDWLIFPSMGAYSSVMSSTFNGFLPASICYTMGPELRCLGWVRGGLSPESELGTGSGG